MNVLGIIPARYASTRFPGKPLADICGKPMIEWVYNNAQKSSMLNDLIVATDDERIADVVNKFGGKVVMTREDHLSGTDRCAEVLSKSSNELKFDVILNIQGDEPLIDAGHIDTLIALFKNEAVDIGTLISPTNNYKDVNNSNRVKVLFRPDGTAFRFGRILPEVRLRIPFYLHIGMYGFKTGVLKKIVQLPPTENELKEKLEQLRWLDNGYAIQVAKVAKAGLSVDVPEDILAVEQAISKL